MKHTADGLRHQLSKRALLRGIGAAGLVGLGGSRAWAAGSYGGPEYTVDPNTMFDVIVIGAGTAGMPLAMWAATRGKVLVIEKAPDIGGTLFLSGGMMSAAGTRLQQRNGIKDTPDMHYEDTMTMCHGKANADVLRLLVDNAADTINWLEDIGMPWGPGQPSLGVHAEFPTRRYHGGPQGGLSILRALTPAFVKAEAAGNIRVLLRTGAVELVQDKDKAVTGVIAVDDRGVRTQYKARNIVMTAGGCMRNPAVFRKYHNKNLYIRGVYAYSMGQGIEMGAAAGAHVTGGEMFVSGRGAIPTDRDWPSPTFARATVDTRRRQPWEIQVNADGMRFIAEDTDVDSHERAVTDQPGMGTWIVWDQEIFDQAPPLIAGINKDQQMAQFSNGHAMFARGETLEEVARRMNLPPQNLVETVRAYNAGVAAKADKFGRKHMPLPIVKAPFYAVETRGTNLMSWAGLNIDGQLRVIDADRRPIKNLYAAGEVTGAWQCSGDTIVNGSMVTPAVTFGRLLGQKMLPI